MMPKKDDRPLSPHLQVYDLPFAAKLSILHRITGFGISLGLILLAISLYALSRGPESWSFFSSFYGSIFGKIILIAFTAALLYHLCNGIRHLLWDTGRGLSLEEAKKSGQLVIITSIALTVFIWVLATFFN